MTQPILSKKQPIGTILINFLICIIPFGIVYVIYKSISDILKTKMPIYKLAEIRVNDKRYSGGSRTERTYRKKTGEKRDLTKDEVEASKFNGRLRLYGLAIFFLVGVILAYLRRNGQI